MINFMVDDAQAAEENRERVRAGYGNAYYDQQAAAVAQWTVGKSKPDAVIIGELPYHSLRAKRIRKEEY